MVGTGHVVCSARLILKDPSRSDSFKPVCHPHSWVQSKPSPSPIYKPHIDILILEPSTFTLNYSIHYLSLTSFFLQSPSGNRNNLSPNFFSLNQAHHYS